MNFSRFVQCTAAFAILSLLCGGPLKAQDSLDIIQGINAQSTYATNDFANIDTSTGRMVIHIPLVVDHSQRGQLNYTYSITGTSNGTYNALCGDGSGYCSWVPSKYGPWVNGSLVMDGLAVGYSVDQVQLDSGLGFLYYASETDLLESSGTSHVVGGDSGRTIDGSGLYSAGPSITNSNGVTWAQTGSTHVAGGEDTVTYTITDPNGNQMSILDTSNESTGASSSTTTDTMGRIWSYAATDTSRCPGGSTKAYLWTVPAPENLNGGTRTFEFCYGTAQINTTLPSAEGASYTYQYSGSATVMTAIILPDNTMWQFGYNDNFADLTDVFLPTGGHVQYTWASIDVGSGILNYDEYIQTVSRRTVYPNAGNNNLSYTWQYNCSSRGCTVTDPLNNDTVFSGLGSTGVIQSITYYSGRVSGGSIIKTVKNGYYAADDPYPCDLEDSASPPQLLTSVTTSWSGSNESNGTIQCYLPGSGCTGQDFTFNDDNWGATNPHNGLYGLVYSASSLNYATGTSPGQPLATTTTAYLAANSNYAAVNILTPVTSVKVTDGGGAQVAQTTYDYDNNNGSGPGNLTSVQHWLSATSALPPSTNSYDSCGRIISSTDPKGNQTSYLYSLSGCASFSGYGTCASGSGYGGSGPTSVTNAAGQTTYYCYDTQTGLVTSTTDPNNATTSWTWDSMLRPAKVVYPTIASGTPMQTVAYNYAGNTYTGSTYCQVITTASSCPASSGSSSYIVTEIDDGLGRKMETQLTSDPDGLDYTDIAYDGDGRVSSVTNPCRSTPASECGSTGYTYDALGRVIVVTEQDGSTITTNYSTFPCTTAADEAGNQRESCVDGMGHLSKVLEDPGASPHFNYETDYLYDGNGNLTYVTQNGSRGRSFSYDWLSRLTQAMNPESETTSYTYPMPGSLCSGNLFATCGRTDDRGITTTYAYVDPLNRITQRSYNDNVTPQVNYTYDANDIWGVNETNTIGRLVWVSTGPSAPHPTGSVFSYNALGQVTTNWQCTPQTCGTTALELDYGYDLAGDLITASNGEGVTISYSSSNFYNGYDGAKRPPVVTSSWNDSQHPATLATVASGFGYAPGGQLQAMTLGNGLTVSLNYNPRFQTCRINVNSSGQTYMGWNECSSAAPTGNYLDMSYSRNGGVSDNGNVAGLAITLGGNSQFSRSYTYDSLNRLSGMAVSSNDPSGCGGLSFTYDAWGNRLTQTDPTGFCTEPSPSYNTSNRIATGLCNTTCYDAAGNVINDSSHQYYYDAENHLIQVDGSATNPGSPSACATATACYTYDAVGHRVQKQTPGPAMKGYIYDLADEVVTEFQNNNSSWGPGYVYFEGQLLAEYANGTTNFVDQDDLGSTRLVTSYSATPSVLECLDYMPFGEVLYDTECEGTNSTTHEFTGKERDPESASPVTPLDGLDDFVARYLSSTFGRFTSPDPGNAGAHPGNPQSWNMYSYVVNNPLRFIDPLGLDVQCKEVTTYTKVLERDVVQNPDGVQSRPDQFLPEPITTLRCVDSPDQVIGEDAPIGGRVVDPSYVVQGPNAPVPNNPCTVAGSAPAPSYYANLGRASDKPNDFMPVISVLGGYFSYALAFRKGGVLDAQVQGAKPAYGNYVFGAFMSSAGVPLHTALAGAQAFAAYEGLSNPDQYPDQQMSGFIPTQNVTNITNGYNAQRNGSLCHK